MNLYEKQLAEINNVLTKLTTLFHYPLVEISFVTYSFT